MHIKLSFPGGITYLANYTYLQLVEDFSIAADELEVVLVVLLCFLAGHLLVVVLSCCCLTLF